MRKTIYSCYAVIQRTTNEGWKHTIQTPTFFLDSSVQGIVDTEHAEAIVKNMFGILCSPGDVVTPNVSREEIEVLAL